MATIEELDFQLVLQDNEFDKKVNKIKNDAQKLNTELSNLLTVLAAAKVVKPEDLQNMQKMNALLEEQNKTESKLNNRRKKRVELEREITAELQKQAATGGQVPQTVNIYEDNSKTINNMKTAQQNFNKEVQRSSKLWTELKNITTAYFSVMGASRLISNLVRVSAEFEKQRISLEAILKDVNGADKIFGQIKDLAVMSPFTFKELVTYTKQLSAFSVPMNELYDTTKMLADVSAGLGVGMDRLILAYGQIRSASFLRGQEVRQLTEAGVPILEELRKQFEEMGEIGITAGQVFDKISARQVTFEMVEKVFKGMTEEGGKFYQMQEVLAETLSGKISNLKDAYQIMFAEIGEKNSGILNKSVDMLRDMAVHYEEIGRTITELIVSFGIYRTLLMALNVATGVTDKGIVKMAGSLKSLMGFLSANPWVAVAAAVTALGFALYKNATQLSASDKLLKSIQKSTDEYNKSLTTEITKLDVLKARIDLATEGTEEYDKAKSALMSRYSDYISQLKAEGKEVDDLASLYENLKIKIEDATKSRFLDTATQDLDKVYGEQVDEFHKKFEGIVKSLESETKHAMTTVEKEALWQFISSRLNMWDLQSKGQTANLAAVLQNANFSGAYDAKKLRTEFQVATSTYSAGLKDISDAYTVVNTRAEESTVELKDWQKNILQIKEEAKGEGIVLNLKVDSQTSLDSVISDVKERLEEAARGREVNAGIEDDIAESYRKQYEYYQKINREVLKGRANPSSSGGSSSQKNPRVDEIKDEIDAYKKLKESYESLIEYMDEVEARNQIRGLAGVLGVSADADFDAEINRLIMELGDLGEAGADAAQSLLQSFAMEAFKKYQEEVKESAEATKQFEEMLKDMDDVFSLAGFSGVSLDIAKIGKSYRDAVSKIAEERAKAVESLDREALSRNMTDSEYEEYLNKIFGFFDIQEANERTEAVDKVREKIEQYYKERRDLLVDFTNLSQKSLGQLEDMKDKIISIVMNGLDEGIVAALEGTEFSAGQVEEILKRLVSFDLSKLDQEANKLIAKKWGQAAKEISELGESIKEVGDAGNNTTLSNFGEMLTQTGEIVQWYTSLMEELAQIELSDKMADDMKSVMESRSLIQAFVSFAVSALSQVLHNIAETQKKLAQAREEIRNILTEGYLDSIRDKVEATSTLFGESFLGNVRAVNNAIGTLKKDIDNIFRSTGGSGKGGLLEFLQALSKASGIKLFDDSGVINKEVLDIFEAAAQGGDFASSAMMAKYGTEFKNLRDLSDELREMLEQLDTTVGEIFSNMGENITDELIDKLNETGEVVSDLEGVFQSLGDTIMKSLIQSVVVDEILAKYREQVLSWFTTDMSADQMAEEMDRFADNVRTDIEAASDKIKGIYDAFKSRDLISGGEASESGLTNGIKGVTEETASLLASYINAIRADVAYNRLQLEDVRGDVRMMVGLLPSTPTLAEYLTQIQANTFNTAARTEAILLHLEELTTAEGGAAALRVFM